MECEGSGEIYLCGEKVYAKTMIAKCCLKPQTRTIIWKPYLQPQRIDPRSYLSPSLDLQVPMLKIGPCFSLSPHQDIKKVGFQQDNFHSNENQQGGSHARVRYLVIFKVRIELKPWLILTFFLIPAQQRSNLAFWECSHDLYPS